MKYDTQYLLEEFRMEQSSLFDEDGKAYRNIYWPSSAERMLQLINQMEKEIRELDEKVKYADKVFKEIIDMAK